MIERIRKTIIDNNMVKSGEVLAVGVSGGPDSVCLLHSLLSLRERLKIKEIVCVHINHMIRGEDADADEAYVLDICRKLKVRCETRKIDVRNRAAQEGISEEVAGRAVRYETFNEVCKMTGAAAVAVAHNRNDQAETVLMRLIRGTGLRGMSGMSYVRNDGANLRIIRPLLDITRDEIERYCAANGLAPHIDKTNLEPVYTRNKLRLELIPYISENFNENIISTLCRISQTAAEADEFISESIERFFKDNWSADFAVPLNLKYETEKCGMLAAKQVRLLPPAMKKRVIIEAFRRIGLDKDISSVHVNAAVRVIDSGRGNKEVEFPSYYAMYINAGKLWFFKKVEMN